MGAVAVHVQPRGQQDPVLHGDGAVREGGNEELVPAWGGENRPRVQVRASSGSLGIGDAASPKGGGGKCLCCGWMWGGKGKPSLGCQGGKKPIKESLKIKAIRAAISSVNRADSEQTALPGAPLCLPAAPALSAPAISSSRSSSGHQNSSTSPEPCQKLYLRVLFGGLLLLPRKHWEGLGLFPVQSSVCGLENRF